MKIIGEDQSSAKEAANRLAEYLDAPYQLTSAPPRAPRAPPWIPSCIFRIMVLVYHVAAVALCVQLRAIP